MADGHRLCYRCILHNSRARGTPGGLHHAGPFLDDIPRWFGLGELRIQSRVAHVRGFVCQCVSAPAHNLACPLVMSAPITWRQAESEC